MKRFLLLIVLLLPFTLAAADKPLVRIPADTDLTVLEASGFELYGQSARYLIGVLTAGAKLPIGGLVLTGYHAGEGELYLLTKLAPEDPAKLTGRVRVLYTEGDEALIQATYEQLRVLPATRAEWVWITMQSVRSPLRSRPDTTVKGDLTARIRPPVTDDFDPLVTEMVAQVSQTQYTQYLQTLQDFTTRNSYHPNCDSAAAWILAQFQSFGLDAYYDYFTLPGGVVRRNVVGERLGSVYPDSILFITAHHDATIGNPSVPEPIAPGADDNGSGTACVLENARILSQYNFEKTIRFVTFAGEEQGLVGSYYYTNHLQQAETNVVGAFNYDMIAYSEGGQPPYTLRIVFDNTLFSEVMALKIDEAQATFTPGIFNPILSLSPGMSGSDHYRFWQHGWPATYAAHGANYPFYHTIADTIGNCDLMFAFNATRIALAALADIGEPLGEIIPLSGAVYGTWTAADNPYFISDSIFVPQDSTLTIMPGVLVLFQGHYPFKIMPNATLKALGTSASPVIFTSTDHAGGWAGLRFLNASDSCRLDFSTISYAINAGPTQYPVGGGVYCDNTDLAISHTLIHHCQAGNGGALALVNGSDALLDHVTFGSNNAVQGAGIYGENSSPVISNSILWDGATEIFSSGSSNPQATYSDVWGGFPGAGNIATDPLFVDPDGSNYHLQSVVGSYSAGGWISNPATSPGIDAADPMAPWSDESEPNGDRADMGSYGNTPQASLSPYDTHYAFGEVSGSWTFANSPMHIISDLVIPAGDTLTIDPGVQVIFENHFWSTLSQFHLTVSEDALLTAVGTYQDSIFFLPEDPAVGWGGLRFDNASDSCRLTYCRMSYAMVNNGTGGGIHCDSTDLILRNCVLDHCRASDGGGLYVTGSNIQIIGSLFYADSASTGGGALKVQNSQATIQTSRFLNNRALNGGALSLWVGQAQITNCVFAQGVASSQGSALYALNSPATVTNCTIVENQSNPAGLSGAVHALGTLSQLTLENCIVWDNIPVQISPVSGAAALVEYSDVMGGYSGMGNLDVNPQFQPGTFSNWQLAAASPCVDFGNPDPAYSDPEDQANPGHALYPAQGFLRNDMGAYGGPNATSVLGVSPQSQPPLPTAFRLSQNRPNPFNPVTIISYQLPTFSHVSLRVYNLSGSLVTTLVDEFRQAGTHNAAFDGSKLSSGIYFVQMQAGEFRAVRKMVLLK